MDSTWPLDLQTHPRPPAPALEPQSELGETGPREEWLHPHGQPPLPGPCISRLVIRPLAMVLQWSGSWRGLTFVEIPPKLMVGAALHDVGHVLCLLVNRHGPHGRARGRWRGHLDLDGARLGDLAVQLLQQWGVLEGEGNGWRSAARLQAWLWLGPLPGVTSSPEPRPPALWCRPPAFPSKCGERHV